MRVFFELTKFHFILYIRNNYFSSLLIMSTLSTFLIQYILLYANGLNYDPSIWIRSGIIGMFTMTVTATGAIGFQRMQHTLPYLLYNVVGNFISLSALLITPVLFGLFSFFISFIMAIIFNTGIGDIDIIFFINILFLLIGSIIMSYFFACLSVVIKSIMVYEPLFTIPILIISGLFSLPIINTLPKFLGILVPVSGPINYLLGFNSFEPFTMILSFILWSIILKVFSSYIYIKSKKDGTWSPI